MNYVTRTKSDFINTLKKNVLEKSFLIIVSKKIIVVLLILFNSI